MHRPCQLCGTLVTDINPQTPLGMVCFYEGVCETCAKTVAVITDDVVRLTEIGTLLLYSLDNPAHYVM